MDKEEFVKFIKFSVRDAAFEDCIRNLSNPPGRKPSQRLLDLSKWFNSLDEREKQMVEKVAKLCLDYGIFGFLSVLDDVRPIKSTDDQSKITLYYETNEQKILLNDTESEYLHDMFKAETNSFST